MKKYRDDSSLKNFCNRFDVVAFNETWQEHESDFINFLPGYETFNSMRKKKRTAPRGSGGISVFVKDWVMQSKGIKRIFAKFNECVVLMLDAAVFDRKDDLILIFTYIAPENSPIYTDEDNGVILLNEKILEIVSEHPRAELFVAGDLNARIGKLQDFIPHDDLEYIFGETEYPTDPFEMSRASKDETQNRFGISLLDLCCMYNIHVLNGRLFEDVKGEITCVVDYMVASTSLFDSFTYFKVGCEDFSDHFPLISRINLTCPGQGIQNTNLNMNGNAWRKFKWKENLKDQFIYSSTTLFAELKTKISRANVPIVVNFLPEFINIYINAGKNMACVNRQQKRRRDQPPWWDADCQLAKAEKYSFLKQFRRTNHQRDFERYKRAKSRFKALCKSKRLH